MAATTDDRQTAVRQLPQAAVFAILCAATAAYSVLQSLVVPALGTFQRTLHTTPAAVAWILTAFLLSASVLTPILGRFADLYGKRRILVYSLLAISVGALVSGSADNLALMIIGRLIQGAGGAVFPLCFAIVRDEFPVARRAQAITAVTTVMSVGGGLGTVTAGPVLAYLSYHWLFWIPAAVSALSAVAAARLVPAPPTDRRGARIGWAGAGLLASWLTLLLLAITAIPRSGWRSTEVLGLAGGAAGLLVLWLLVEYRARHPLIDLATLALPTVRATNAATLLLGFGMFGSWMLVPLLVQQPADSGVGFGASPAMVGLVMLPTTLGNMLVMLVSARLSSRRGPRVTLLVGTMMAGASYIVLAVAHHQLAVVCSAVLLMGAGVGLAFPSVASLIVEAVPLAQTGVAAGVNTVMRTVGGTLGATIAGTLLTSSLTVSGHPSDRAYTTAFLVFATALGVSCLLSVRVPRTVGHDGAPPRPEVAFATG